MSNPETAAAHVDFPEDKAEAAVSTGTSFDIAAYEKEVVQACNEMEFDDNGKWKVPEGMPLEKQFAVNAERRRRDTQSAHAKAQQEVKVLSTKNIRLLERLESTVKPNLTVEQAEELEDLKESDAEAWRDKLNEYEEAAIEAHQATLSEIDGVANETAEIARREDVLEQFLSDNPELQLNDYVFNNDLPQGLTGKLTDGEISFEDFLEAAKEFLMKGKKIAGADEKTQKEPNLGKSSGGSKPDFEAIKIGEEEGSTYEKTIF